MTSLNNEQLRHLTTTMTSLDNVITSLNNEQLRHLTTAITSLDNVITSLNDAMTSLDDGNDVTWQQTITSLNDGNYVTKSTGSYTLEERRSRETSNPREHLILINELICNLAPVPVTQLWRNFRR